jgi:hypothetical protein
MTEALLRVGLDALDHYERPGGWAVRLRRSRSQRRSRRARRGALGPLCSMGVSIISWSTGADTSPGRA